MARALLLPPLAAVLAAAATGVEERQMPGAECQLDSKEVQAGSLLQNRKAVQSFQEDLVEQDQGKGRVAGSWTVSPWGDCTRGCGPTPLQFRNASCVDAFTARQLPSASCAGPKPALAAACQCGTQLCRDAGACPSSAAAAPVSTGGFERVGCAEESPAPASAGDLPFDEGCLQWRGPCHAGLPFYKFAASTAEACFERCMAKGLDVFGLAASACRCGASAANRMILRTQGQKAFEPGVLRDPASGGCPVEVYRYVGHFEGEGVPASYWAIGERDLRYTDSIVMGHRVSAYEEEFGSSPSLLERPSPFWVDHRREPPAWPPSWQRHCYPHRCMRGKPWHERTSQAPEGAPDLWQGYTLVPYVFGNDVDASRKEVFRAAADEIRNLTCVNFIEADPVLHGGPRASASSAVVVVHGHGACSATMGYPCFHWMEAKVHMGWCNSMREKAAVLHELGHTLGMAHEMMRPDATQEYFGHGPHVVIHWENMADEEERRQYLPYALAYTGSASDGFQDPVEGYAPYDFDSLMHYPASDRMQAVLPENNAKLGAGSTFSAGDVLQINDMYQCKPKCTQGPCPSAGPTASPTPYPTPAPTPAPSEHLLRPQGRCSFEAPKSDGAYCGMWMDEENENYDNMDFTLQEGPTPTGGTGPQAAQDGAKYLFLEASDGHRAGSYFAMLKSMPLAIDEETYLTFWYHMFGSGVGYLLVDVSDYENPYAPPVTAFRVEGSSGQDWLRASVDLLQFLGQKVVISIFAVRGGSASGDIALDNLAFGSQPPPATAAPTPAPPPPDCSFESPKDAEGLYCGLWFDLASPEDETDWTRHAGKTPTSGTGPGKAKKGDFFLFFEADDVPEKKDRAVLRTKPFKPGRPMLMEFHYMLKGADVGKLEVHVCGYYGCFYGWKKGGDRGSKWSKGSVDLTHAPGYGISGEVFLEFVAFRGEGKKGDIAIDNIRFKSKG